MRLRTLAVALALSLTPLPVTAAGQTHVVEAGQTLGGIARRYGTSIDAICRANSIQRTEPIQVGQSLRIPGSERSPRRPASRRRAGRHHTVVSGDTLGGLARKYGISIEALTRANGIRRTDPLRIGQELTLPEPGKPVRAPVRTHVVASGQTLGAIARRYHTSIAALTTANGIDRRRPIRVGQKLVIPDSRDEDGSRTRAAVQAGSDGVSAPRVIERRAASSGALRLDVPGALPAYYYEPTGPGRKTLRPVLMYLHGRGAIPGAYCARWARVVRDFGWLVCPVGPEDRGGGKRGWGNNWATGRRIVTATLAALRKKYGRRVQLYGNTLMGFSEGAYVAMNVGLREPRAFNRWLILGADTDYWGPHALQTLRAHRGRIRRVYLITGRRDIVYHETQGVKNWLRQAGVPVRITTPTDMGHTVALESKPSLYQNALRWLERG